MPERLHNALQRSPIADGVKKAVGQHKQGEGGLERWGETLTPVINPWGMPEWAFLRLERLGAVKAFTAAVAAEFGIVGVSNPAGSNTIIVVEAVSFASTAASFTGQLEVVAHSVIVGTVVTTPNLATARDRRHPSAGGRLQMVAGTDPANTFGVPLEVRVTTAASVIVDYNCLPVILKPGDDLVIVGQTVNLAITSNWSWRERQAFPGELT